MLFQVDGFASDLAVLGPHRSGTPPKRISSVD